MELKTNYNQTRIPMSKKKKLDKIVKGKAKDGSKIDVREATKETELDRVDS